MNNANASLGWLGIARLGLVQAMLGAVVVLTTSTLSRPQSFQPIEQRASSRWHALV